MTFAGIAGGVVVMPTVYHGTPMTPRAALLDVCAGRAMCVSFWRPDDVEAVEAISPAIMFRQRRIFRVASRPETRRGLVHPAGLDPVFRVAGTAPVSTGTMGGHAGCAGCAVTAQRQPLARLAFWGPWSTAVAHGRTDRTAAPSLRETLARLPWLDRCGQASRPARFSRADGGDRPGARQPLAGAAHDARDRGQGSLAVRFGGRDHAGTKRVAV